MPFKYVLEVRKGENVVSKCCTVSRDPENVEPYIKTNPTSKINDCLEGKNG